MGILDWTVLTATLAFIILYGIWASRKQSNLNSYLLGSNDAKWWTVGLSVMATQASAITFLSTPGQAYHDGLGFVQFYFGLPIAMIIICVGFLPIYKKLKVYTAYEYLETRFDLKTRSFTAILFLIQRGLAAGITIFAPSIILSTLIGWNLNLTILIIGSLVTLYTVLGGTKAVNVTHKYQMSIIFLGLLLAFFIIVFKLPPDINFSNALQIAGASDKMKILDFSFDLDNRYTFWSGMIGGTFLALSYFGTDQSQVQRYLSSASLNESRKGLIFNGLLKVPLQFFILLIGVMVFVFYQFNQAPIFFNTQVLDQAKETSYAGKIEKNETSLALLTEQKTKLFKREDINESVLKEYKSIIQEEKILRSETKELLKQAVPNAETNDKDYVFLHFILNNIPRGILGLLLAMILSAAMSSTASELNALASTTTIDLFKRSIVKNRSEAYYLTSSKLITLLWGVIAMLFACFGTLFENLIQFVNIIGSIFYGTILGIFVCGFFIPYIKSNAVFIAGVFTECIIIYLWWIDFVPFLWLNLIGCLLVIFIATLIQLSSKKKALLT